MDQRQRDRIINGLRARIRWQADHGGQLLLMPIEVATLFRVGPRTVNSWGKTGRLPSIKTLGGHRRYPWEPVERQLRLLNIEVPK